MTWEHFPPNGWSTAFIDIPHTLGYNLPCALNLWKRTPAFKNGFSGLPEPATIPKAALHNGENNLSFLDGNFILIPLF